MGFGVPPVVMGSGAQESGRIDTGSFWESIAVSMNGSVRRRLSRTHPLTKS